MIRKGFTLIEMLVVISIIALLSSIAITSTNIARAKARDTKKIAESTSVKTAITSYTIDHNRVPDNYVCTDSCQKVGGGVSQRSTLEVEDMSNPLNPQTEPGKAYRATMNDLVTGGYLVSVPQSTGGAAYVYYDYGHGSAAGGLFGTVLDTAPATTNGISGSCRPNGNAQVAVVDTRSDLARSFIGSMLAAVIIHEQPVRHLDDRTGNGTLCPNLVTNPSGDPCGSWVACIDGGYFSDFSGALYNEVNPGNPRPLSCDNSSSNLFKPWTSCPADIVTYPAICNNLIQHDKTVTNICDNNSTTDYCICVPY